jgi:hypothetical protein
MGKWVKLFLRREVVRIRINLELLMLDYFRDQKLAAAICTDSIVTMRSIYDAR